MQYTDEGLLDASLAPEGSTGPTQQAIEAAQDEYLLRIHQPIWESVVQNYAYAQRERHRQATAAYLEQERQEQLTLATHLTAISGRSLDHAIKRELDTPKGQISVQHADEPTSFITSAFNGEDDAATREKKEAKRLAAIEGWRKRKEAAAEAKEVKAARAEARRLAQREKVVLAQQERASLGYQQPLPAADFSYDYDLNDSSRPVSPAPSESLSAPGGKKRAASSVRPAKQVNGRSSLAPTDLGTDRGLSPSISHDSQANGEDEDMDVDYPEQDDEEDALFEEPEEEEDADFKPSSHTLYALSQAGVPRPAKSSTSASLNKTATIKGSAKTTEELERKLWTQIAKTQIPKVAKLASQSTASRMHYAKRLSAVVSREAKRVVNRSKGAKEVQTKAKRVMREMLIFWKGNEKKEREGRKAAEKMALDRARKEEEMREAKRAARKLNFLITQTELYSHFIGSKIKST